jgi:hypothetical protein
MTRLALLAMMAVGLPTAGALLSVVLNETALRDATEWRIPITGYDPRDPLRGRYIAFRYDWLVSDGPVTCRPGECVLCLEQGGRAMRVAPRRAACAGRVDTEASGLSVSYSLEQGQARASAATRLWVSESRAPALEESLRRRPMVAVARLTRGGRLVAQKLEPAQ